MPGHAPATDLHRVAARWIESRARDLSTGIGSRELLLLLEHPEACLVAPANHLHRVRPSSIVGSTQCEAWSVHTPMHPDFTQEVNCSAPPMTADTLSRFLNPESEWVAHEAPEVRLTDQDVWDSVKTRHGRLAYDLVETSPNPLNDRRHRRTCSRASSNAAAAVATIR